MALNNHILTITEPQIQLDELKFPSLKEEEGDTKISKSFGTDRIPFVIINNYTFNDTDIKNFEIRNDGFIPTIELTIVDSKSQFSVDTFPRDGDVISVRIGSKQQDQYKDIRIDFDIDRVDSGMKLTTEIGSGGAKYSFTGKMKVPGLYAEECKSYGVGTSLDHLETIANDLELGLSTNIDESDDEMNLVIAYQSVYETIEDLAKHSYVSDESFQTIAIDPYYYLNYVDMNALLNSENDFNEDVIFGLIDNFNEEASQDNSINELKTKNLLTNHPKFESVNLYIGKYALNNKAGSKVKKNGYKRTLQFFEDDSDEGLISFDIQPLNSENLKDIEEPLRGRRDEERYKREVKFKYMGRKDSDPDTANTHLNYTFAALHNKQNLEEIDKLSLNVELPALNPALHRFQKIPVMIFNITSQQTNADSVLKEKKGDKGFDTTPSEDFNDDKLSDKTTMDEFLSGFYIINSIVYKYNNRDGKVRQEMNLIRREWPSRINNIG